VGVPGNSHHTHRTSTPLIVSYNTVPGGAGDGRHDSRGPPGQRVHQGRFACERSTQAEEHRVNSSALVEEMSSLIKLVTHRCSYQTRGLDYTPGVECAIQAHGVWTGEYHDTIHCYVCNLPALGGPTSAMCTPSRTISPRRPSCRCLRNSSRSLWTCVSVSMPLVHSLNDPKQ
jgi:hypothetical protein